MKLGVCGLPRVTKPEPLLRGNRAENWLFRNLDQPFVGLTFNANYPTCEIQRFLVLYWHFTWRMNASSTTALFSSFVLYVAVHERGLRQYSMRPGGRVWPATGSGTVDPQCGGNGREGGDPQAFV